MEVSVDVVVKGHHCEVSDRFRQYVEEKLERIEKVDHRVLRCEVEVSQEKNPRQHDRAMRVELTMYTKGPVVRAEACGETKQAGVRRRNKKSPIDGGFRGRRCQGSSLRGQ